MVIDLDAPVPARPETPRRGALPVALVAVVLVVLTLGGSVAPPPGLRQVLQVNATGAFALTSTALFTAGFGRAPGRQAIVRRHPFGGDPVRWSVELAQTVGRLHVIGPVLVAEPAEVLITTAADQQQTSFLDGDTGTVRWRTRTAAILSITAAGVLTSDAGQLRRADLRTGRTLWSREVGPTDHLDAGGDTIVWVGRRGDAAVLDPADGRLLATAALGVAPGDTARYSVAGDHLYLARQDNGAASLLAYSLPDLRLRWRNSTAPAGRPTWCGPEHLCVTTAAGVTVLDRGTGTRRWSEDRWRTGFDTRALGIPGPGRIAVVDGRPDVGGALLDPATGEVTARLGAVTFAGATILRTDRDRPGRTLLQVVGPAGDVRTVGALEAIVASRCASSGDHLACPTNRGRLQVWRVPR